MKNQKGFSLIELLVVVIIIAIIAAIAIPSLLASRRAANESSAIGSLRTIHSAQATWYATDGANTQYAADLAALNTAGLVDAQVATGSKSGYTLATSPLAATSTAAAAFCALGTPQSTGATGTGTRTFGIGLPGVLYGTGGTPATSPACAAGAFTIGGTVIQ